MTDSAAGDLELLVERTAGPQPLRRLFHAASGLFLAAVLALGGVERHVLLLLLGGIFLVQCGADLLRARVPAANRLFYRVFRHLAAPRDARGLASSSWYTLGVLLAVAFFPLPAAISGTLVLAVADPAASYLGRRFGRRPFLGGTLEGTAVFFLTAAGILAVRHPPALALSAAALAALVERRSWPLDDNLVLPPVTAAALTLLGGTLG